MKTLWKNSGIKWRMIRLLVFGWIVPLAAATVLVTVVMSVRLSKQMRETVTNSLSKVASLIEAGFDECNKASRDATYLGVVQEAYNEYLNTYDEQKLYNDITVFLTGQYRYNKRSDCVMLIFTEKPELFYSAYDSSASYKDVMSFRQNGLNNVLALSGDLDTGICLYTDETGMYLARNLVTSSYKPYAMIVMKLNPDEMFGSLKSVWGYDDAAVYVDGALVYGDDLGFTEISKQNFDTAFFHDSNKQPHAHYTSEIDRSIVTLKVQLNKAAITSEKKVGIYIVIILLLSLFPLCFIVLRFFDRMVKRPVDELVTAAEEISRENYGYEIEKEANSKEFNYVNGAFNDMSRKLQQQFEQIYLEELAVRDANIKALQSQINPHFINNTLEIINWEARLNGIYKVSGMIEALSTMLNATLNRSNIQRIRLSEEMKYVDAYLYIISERMGKRLTIKKDIDESLLNETVPRLIAQPIVENAIEHGISDSGTGSVSIRIYAENEYMYMEVRNTGHMTEQDKEKIRAILSGETEGMDQRSVSIGISNVNKRLKLMYGDSCGLSITDDEEGTVSLLTFMREGGETYGER
ncbi:MAG: sensor histidine kinase [Lachnospiraceae bacterium]|nr:sensor histidine kinase [Lachnospiraceae bacterium]